ncbi:hypothetical protein ATX59_07480 [Oenococcus oeni]|uniref:NAD-dependent epimerase/dehydratase domain-containing protein n=1 Tax=Oenococcus oeni TaxID=1247 RepID=A0A6N4A020_OENOE|nr:NAD-dependent epimerase/dehydratase family protein [Oenococcus oeni]OIM20750.1 hypothetical protein ATX59_07480 [Oenococcus oeni]
MSWYENTIVQEDLKMISQQDLPYDNFFGRNVLVTGATGMLASYLVDFFIFLNKTQNAKINIFVLARSKNKIADRFGKAVNDQYFHSVIQDIVNPIILPNISSIDYIFHAAGNASAQAMRNSPVSIWTANVIGMHNVLELARVSNATQVHFFSTREVYGNQLTNKTRLTENDFGVLDPLNPRAVYPESKLASESLMAAYKKQFGQAFTISRIAHSYGPGMSITNDGRIMSDLIGNVVRHENISLISSGQSERAFLYIADAIAGILHIVLKGGNGQAYNLSNEDQPIKIVDLARKLSTLFAEKHLRVTFISSDQSGYSSIPRVALDSSKLEKIGWHKRISLDSGLRRTVQSFEIEGIK